MPKPWSSLQKSIYALMDDSIGLQIHCMVYRMKRGRKKGQNTFPRYTITLNGETLWDYPKDFLHILNKEKLLPRVGSFIDPKTGESFEKKYCDYIYYPDYGYGEYRISRLLAQYVNTPAEKLYAEPLPFDFWGLTYILLAADRRVGKRRFSELREKSGGSNAVVAILAARERGDTGGQTTPI